MARIHDYAASRRAWKPHTIPQRHFSCPERRDSMPGGAASAGGASGLRRGSTWESRAIAFQETEGNGPCLPLAQDAEVSPPQAVRLRKMRRSICTKARAAPHYLNSPSLK